MNPAATTPAPRLVTTTREQYLRQNEARIRSLALPQNTSDPVIALHLDAVLWLEDVCDIHEIAEAKFRRNNTPHLAATHTALIAKLTQIKLHHLDQLAHLLV